MSDDVLSVIPTDPRWQPAEIDVTWHDTLTVVDCGQNLQKIGCPHCGASNQVRATIRLTCPSHGRSERQTSVTISSPSLAFSPTGSPGPTAPLPPYGGSPDLLLRLWPVLRTLVGHTVRTVWEDAFPRLASPYTLVLTGGYALRAL
ncbi:hypothetical protein [Streptomyces sp. MAR4 CNX-425]|uniref:hypothetical protein n=1 Tax=Streptomyces sp. MAR4 CNX-425 TaxID=3406343 RepID=UPI003B50B978